MNYEQDPDYNYLKSLFSKVLTVDNKYHDSMFDWIKGTNSSRTLSTIVPNIEVKLNGSNDNNKNYVTNLPYVNSIAQFDQTNKGMTTIKVNNDTTNHLKKKSSTNIFNVQNSVIKEDNVNNIRHKYINQNE